MRSGTDVTVDRDALERRLDELRGRVSDPRSGIFGPGSMAWEIDREIILLAGGGRATLLQLAHPFVAYAIEQHSVTKSDLAGRFQRTFANIHAMAFGDLESAIRSARRVWSIHSRVHGEITDDAGRFPKGSRYEALDADAIIWVWSTLVDSAVVAFELAVRTPDRHEKERYYDKSRLFAFLFGIRSEDLPADWSELERYNREMWASDTLAVSRPAAEMARFLLTPRRPWLRALIDEYEVLTAGIMPRRLREEYGLAYSPHRFRRATNRLRMIRRMTPRRLRYIPSYTEAQRRLQGMDARDRVGEFFYQGMMKLLLPPGSG